MRLTPLHIEIMLHYACTSSPFPRLGAPACAEYAQQLYVEGLLMDDGAGFKATDKGKAWIHYLCEVPFPIQQWVLPLVK